MSAAAWPLQEAVATAVSAAVSPVPVVDVFPVTPSYPFVVVGDDEAKDWSTSESFGEDVTVVVHVWSQDPDRAELKSLQQQIYSALHNQDIAVVGYNVAAVVFISSDSVFDDDKAALRGTSKFRCLLST